MSEQTIGELRELAQMYRELYEDEEPSDGPDWHIYHIRANLLNRAADELERLRGVAAKLPKTRDGVSVVPPVDPIWINPTEIGGWLHEVGRGEPHPIKSDSWAFYGDHIWFASGEGDEGDHWFGEFYSTEAAAIDAKGGEPALDAANAALNANADAMIEAAKANTKRLTGSESLTVSPRLHDAQGGE